MVIISYRMMKVSSIKPIKPLLQFQASRCIFACLPLHASSHLFTDRGAIMGFGVRGGLDAG